MAQTLFHIPNQVAGINVFGFGLLLAAWCLFGVILMAWAVWRQGFTADTWSYVPLLAVVAAAIWFVLPKLCDSVGLPIRGYGVMLLVAVVSGVGLAAWRAYRLGIDPELIYTLAFWAFVPGILGARLFYVIQFWSRDFAPVYQQDGLTALLGSLVNIAQGGIVAYGSFVGGLLGLVAFFIKYKMPMLATLDLVAPSMMLGLAIGRVGCFMNGCCFGGACELPWAVEFPALSLAHVHEVRAGEAFLFGMKFADASGRLVVSEVEPGSIAEREGLRPGQTITAVAFSDDMVRDLQERLFYAAALGGPFSITVTDAGGAARTVMLHGSAGHSVPVHPTQIYSAINAALICLFLLALGPFCRRDGQLWLTMLTIYPITRFLLEIIRTDEGSAFGTGLTISQNVSLAVLAAAAVAWVVLLTQKPRPRAFPGQI